MSVTARCPSLVECLFPRHGVLGSLEQDSTVLAGTRPASRRVPVIEDSGYRKDLGRSARTVASIRAKKGGR